jgi:hypothetical protein
MLDVRHETANWAVSTDDAGEMLVDEVSRTSARAAFFGSAFFGSSSRLFGCLHAPLSAPTAGVIICPPLCAEAARNYRREVLLARTLAARGIAVLRFHYRGSGNSDGESWELSLATMIEDTVAATDHLRELTGLTSLSFLGTRLGSAVAATVAARFDSAPLALWDPAVDPDAYFREVFRAKMMSNLKRGGTGGVGVPALVQELEHRGYVDVCGYPITWELYRTSQQHPVQEALGTVPRPILIVEMNGRDRSSKHVMALVETWQRTGFSVETHVVAPAEPWWFGAAGRNGRADAAVTGEQVVSATADFLGRRLGVRE